METPVKTMRLLFEMEPCGRCGGTGTHQFNQRDGHVCWGCSGRKERLSSRGKRASEAYTAALVGTAANVAPADLVPGMRIWAKAHHASHALATYKEAWRTVASCEVSAVFPATRMGMDEDGRPCDVSITCYTIRFEDGRHWTATHSEDAAYWRKGAHHSVDTTQGFDVSGEEATAVRREAMADIARRFSGAWLEGEEPPAPAVRKPRMPRPEVAEVLREAKAAPVTPAAPRRAVNLYPGDCLRCGKRVGKGEGERLRTGDGWAVQHRDGECPA
jgi:hypothetical protein